MFDEFESSLGFISGYSVQLLSIVFALVCFQGLTVYLGGLGEVSWWLFHIAVAVTAFLLTCAAVRQSYLFQSWFLLCMSYALLSATFFASIVTVYQSWAVWGLVAGAAASLLLGFLPASYLVFIPLALLASIHTGQSETFSALAVATAIVAFLRVGNVGRSIRAADTYWRSDEYYRL